MSVVILLNGLCSDQQICSTSLFQSMASGHFCVVCEVRVAVSPDPAVYRESSKIRAIDRAAVRADLCMRVSRELCPSTDEFKSSLQSVLAKHAPLCRRLVRVDRLEPRY